MKHHVFMQQLLGLVSQTEIGNLYSQLEAEGHLSGDQARAALLLLQDIRLARNSETHVASSSYKERIQNGSSHTKRTRAEGVSSLDAMAKGLQPLQREMLISMMRVSGKRGCVSEISTSTKYITPKSRKAYAVAQVASLLDAIAHAYDPAQIES